MANVFITRELPPPAADLVRDAGHDVEVSELDGPMPRERLLEAVRGRNGLIVPGHDRIDAELLDAAGESLRIVSLFAVGYDNVDVGAATQRRVAICNTPGVLTEATADVAWALLLGVARRVAEADRLIREDRYPKWTPLTMAGHDIIGRTLAIVGAGRIGYAVAKRARAWDMRILYVARSRHERFEQDFGAVRMDIDDALREADFVSLHVPRTDETHHLIDERRLKLMKRTAYLINTARGSVIDEAALVRALNDGTIAGAGLDVYEHEPELTPGLAQCVNTVLLPHVGSSTIETRQAMSRLAAENLVAVLAGRRPKHVVNEGVLA